MTQSHQGGCRCINRNFYRYDSATQDKKIHKAKPRHFRAQGADVLVKAKHILTMNPQQPDVSAVVIRDGYIVALGQEKELSEWITPQTCVLDYQDNTLVPGFIEAHSHPLLLGIGLRHLNLTFDAAPTRAKVLEAIAAWAKTNTDRQWVIGWGYDPSVLDDIRPLSREELDAACPDRPVFIANNSLHLAYVNTKACALAKIDKNTPNPTGGQYIHDAAGELSGEVQELSAVGAFLQTIPAIGFDHLTEAAYSAAHMFQKQGFTTIVDAGLGLAAHHADLACYRAVAHNPDFPVRVIACPYADIYDSGIAWSEIGDKHLKFGAVKYVIDGSMQGFTANLSEAYLDRPDTSGHSTVDEAVFRASLLKTHQAGNQAFIHANGDAAIEMALEAIDYVQSVYPRQDHRHRIEHCQLPSQKQLTRMKDLGIYPNFFVSHIYFWGDVHVNHTLGAERAANMNPLAWAEQQNITFTLHSDAPVTLPNAIQVLWIATNRKTRSGKSLGPEQCITPLAAIKAMTLDAAFTLHEDHRLGSIEVGKLGDFAVLDKNPLDIPVSDLNKIKVVTTILGGLDTQSKAD
jgi:hypothetical protein